MEFGTVFLFAISLFIGIALAVGLFVFIFKVPTELENIAKSLRCIQSYFENDVDDEEDFFEDDEDFT